VVLVAAGVAAVIGYVYLGGNGEPLRTPPDVATGLGTFAFAAEQPGHPGAPVTYRPCERIRYVVNEAYAPAGGSALVDDAVREVSLATGLVFEKTGATDGLPFTSPTAATFLGKAGPVVIAWTSPAEVPELAGEVAGVGGSTAEHGAGTVAHYVTGGVALDGPDLAAILQRPDGPQQARAHHARAGPLVGLDHVDDPAELMYTENVGLHTFGPGDREGLAALGSGSCA
jgi:hypothetical protein